MPRHNQPRRGSLQFYPRKRVEKILPRINWNAVKKEERGLAGFIGYKVGMLSAFVIDNTVHSKTKGQRIIVPVTLIECPDIKILSIRFYKQGKVANEVMNDNLDKELKRKLRLPKQAQSGKKIEEIKDGGYDDIRVIIYSQSKKTGIKKTPDIAEIGIFGTFEEKLKFAKENFKKEISVKDVFKGKIIDIRGVTKGKGFQGSTKRFGLALQAHKSEKGVRGPGTGGPWHPARVTFEQPMAGQMGYFTRAVFNSNIVAFGNINEKDINKSEGFKHYGKIKTNYLVLQGSVQGPCKRQLLLTYPSRPSKKQKKKEYELIELR